LHAPGLEQIGDCCTAYNAGRKGKVSDVKRAWVEMVIEHLDSANADDTPALPAWMMRAQ
jgi:hypothetical protein